MVLNVTFDIGEEFCSQHKADVRHYDLCKDRETAERKRAEAGEDTNTARAYNLADQIDFALSGGKVILWSEDGEGSDPVMNKELEGLRVKAAALAPNELLPPVEIKRK